MLLYALSVFELKKRALPGEMVLGFATTGLVFHLTTLAQFVPIPNIVLGGFAGFFALCVLRFIVNRIFREKILQWRDAGLMGGAGIWLGFDGLMLALAAGTSLVLIHGLVHGIWTMRQTGATGLDRFKVPVVPGFAAGILLAGTLQFWHFSLRY